MGEATNRLDEQVLALERGRAFVDRSSFRRVLVRGTDAGRWLNDLVTAGLWRLGPGEGTRALLLSPTGRIRADVHVLCLDTQAEESFLLVQDLSQPRGIDELLAPYVLSSDVELSPGGFAVFCLPSSESAPAGLPTSRPSMLGDGIDVLVPERESSQVRELLLRERHEAAEEAVEVRRIRNGEVRFPVDVDEDSLPAEAGLDDLVVDLAKGCFLGQESVAKVHNLGHAQRVVLALRAAGRIATGEHVLADGGQVGVVTSATPGPSAGETALLARVRWEAREARLAAASGQDLIPA